MPRPLPDNLSLLQYSPVTSILAVYLFYLASDPGHLEHTVLTEKILALVLCFSHPLWPCPAQSLLTQVQSLQKGKVKTADVERAREELRALVTAVRAALDHSDRWGGRPGLVRAGLHYYYWPHYYIIGLRV